MKKWYNVELFKAHEIKALRSLLIGGNYQFEISGCYSGAHFEIYCTPQQAMEINEMIDKWAIDR